jgi:RNA polymerase sigma factor (sigma-70 family)
VSLGESFDGVLAAARAGGEWAWRELHRELAPAVLGYLRARGAPEPEDLAGEVFVQVVRDIEGFDGGEVAFRAWVLTIAHHRLLDELRRRARRPAEPTDPTELGEKGAAPAAEDEALGGIADERVQRALGRLSDDQRSVVLLRVIGDLSVEQVANVLGKTTGAIKALQHRALTALKREISKMSVTL